MKDAKPPQRVRDVEIQDIPSDKGLETVVPRCGECLGRGCDECDDTGIDPETRWWLAAEATRLWRRDIGRGVTTGTKDVYIGFAFESLREGRKAA